jgi:hypothetical protein
LMMILTIHSAFQRIFSKFNRFLFDLQFRPKLSLNFCYRPFKTCVESAVFLEVLKAILFPHRTLTCALHSYAICHYGNQKFFGFPPFQHFSPRLPAL